MPLDSLLGTWDHNATHEGRASRMTQTFYPDGRYRTDMAFALSGGCRQRIGHEGTVEIIDGRLHLAFERGTTQVDDCTDASANFAERPFTEEEEAETRAMLGQAIPFTVDGDTFTTSVEGPSGAMTVAYKRRAG